MNNRELLQLALEYLKLAKLYGPPMAYANTTIDDAIRGLEAAITQPEQAPVAWLNPMNGAVINSAKKKQLDESIAEDELISEMVQYKWNDNLVKILNTSYARGIAQGAANERKMCANVADELYQRLVSTREAHERNSPSTFIGSRFFNMSEVNMSRDIAEAIRARKQNEQRTTTAGA